MWIGPVTARRLPRKAAAFMRPSRNMPRPRKGIRYERRLLAAALSCLVTVTGSAQIIYLSDNRSVEGSGSAQFYNYPSFQPIASTNYSASQTPAASFAANAGNVGATVTLTPSGDSGISSFSASQNSIFTSEEMSSVAACTAFAWASGNDPGTAHGTATAIFNVGFAVSAPVPYTLMIITDPYSIDSSVAGLSYDLTSAAGGQSVLGTATKVPNPFSPSWAEALVPEYSGVLEPGDIYTIDASLEVGAGQMNNPNYSILVDLAIVPEPSSSVLATVGMFVLTMRWLLRRSGRPVWPESCFC